MSVYIRYDSLVRISVFSQSNDILVIPTSLSGNLMLTHANIKSDTICRGMLQSISHGVILVTAL
jgi:hypothetical protein